MRTRSVDHLRQLKDILVQWQGQLDGIEQANDIARKQQLLSLVIREVRVDLVLSQGDGKPRKGYDLHVACLV